MPCIGKRTTSKASWNQDQKKAALAAVKSWRKILKITLWKRLKLILTDMKENNFY
jgi:hypothetical protein